MGSKTKPNKKQEKLAKMANPDLPEEILLEIFSRTPAKSVGKCRTLSKSWNTHLSTSNFIKKHLITRKQTIQQEHLAIVTKVPRDTLHIITSPTKRDEVFDVQSFTDEGGVYGVLGSCNGLILGHYLYDLRYLMLVNPITRKKVTIQLQVISKHNDLGDRLFVMRAFGYDSCSDDYKIVEICSYSRDGLVNTVVDVYSVKNGVWKRVDGCYPYGEFIPRRYEYRYGAFVNGALHLLICSEEGYRSCIAAFDLAKKVFREIPLPKEFVRQVQNELGNYWSPSWMKSNYGVSVVGGCLLIVDNHGNGATDVWIMREYGVADSWVKFRIQSKKGIYKWNSIAATLCYLKDGELLCLTDKDILFSCNLKGGTMKKVVLGGQDARYVHGMAFVDSLVSPI